jgi:hypothetical protein
MLMQTCRTDLKMLAMSLNSGKNFTQGSHFSDMIFNLLNTSELLLERYKADWSYLALNSRKNVTQDNSPSNMVFNLSSTSELPLQKYKAHEKHTQKHCKSSSSFLFAFLRTSISSSTSTYAAKPVDFFLIVAFKVSHIPL